MHLFLFHPEPSEGYALDTEFRVACSGWTDDDPPLSYKFAYKTSEDDFEQLIYFGSKSETPPVKLPLGKPHLNYSVMVIVDSTDSFLAPNVTILNVTVSECYIASSLSSFIPSARKLIRFPSCLSVYLFL